MFKLPADQGERIIQALASRICTMPDGSYISKSFGRKMASSRTRYHVHFGEEVHTVLAYSDSEAVDKANALVKEIQRKMKMFLES